MTVKALMHGLSSRPSPIPTLYVKSAEGDYGEIYAVRQIFKKARKCPRAYWCSKISIVL